MNPKGVFMSEDYKIYKIVKGDNLTRIAKEFGTTVDTLVKLNNIANPNLIYADAELKIPKTEAEIAADDTAAKEAAAKVAAAKAKAAQVAAAKKAEVDAAAKKAEEEASTLKGKIAGIFKKDNK